MAVSYDPNVDYSDLIAQEAAKGVNANRQLLAQYEAQRNAKIAGERLPYTQTSVYTSEMGRPLGYYEAEDRSDYNKRALRCGQGTGSRGARGGIRARSGGL